MPETPVGYLPDYNYQWDIANNKAFSTLIQKYKSGREQRRKLQTVGLRSFYGSLASLSLSQREILWDFIDEHFGPFVAFYAFIPAPEQFTDWNIGTASSDTSWVIPVKSSTITQVKINDTPIGYTVSSGIGAGGEDRVNFIGGPYAGSIKISGTGRIRIVSRFSNDMFDENFIPNSGSVKAIVSVSIQELRSN